MERTLSESSKPILRSFSPHRHSHFPPSIFSLSTHALQQTHKEMNTCAASIVAVNSACIFRSKVTALQTHRSHADAGGKIINVLTIDTACGEE